MRPPGVGFVESLELVEGLLSHVVQQHDQCLVGHGSLVRRESGRNRSLWRGRQPQGPALVAGLSSIQIPLGGPGMQPLLRIAERFGDTLASIARLKSLAGLPGGVGGRG